MLLGMDKHLVGGILGLLNAYLGIGSNIVEPPSRGERKSIGVETWVIHIDSTKNV